MVWVTQPVRHFNILPAKQYGEIKMLWPEGQGATFATGAAISKIKMELSKFNYEEDFLLLIGDPVLIAVTSAVVNYWTNGRFKVLKWDKQERQYIPVSIEI